MARFFLALLTLAALSGCGRNEGALQVAFIDDGDDLFASGVRLSPAAQHVRAAIRSGLVAFDESGEVVPALADRWIVTDDGLSFIFRLRDGRWPDGAELTGPSVRVALDQAMRALRGTALGLELRPVAQVRAMAGRVVEIRLSEPVPSLLQLLAQPELGLAHGGDTGRGASTGPMLLERRGDVAVLTMKPPSERGLPDDEAWRRHVRPVALRALSPARAVEQFDDGAVDVVLGGRLADLPLAPTGPLSRGTVQLDPALGLFGLQVRRAEGFLAEPRNREALSLALDRSALIAPFNIGGWIATTRLVPPGVRRGEASGAERWGDQPLDNLRAQGAARVAAWRRAHGGAPVELTIAMPRGPGSRVLASELAAQLATVGIAVSAVAPDRPADLVLVDRVARFAEARWYLDQFNCALRQGLCDGAADDLLRAAGAELDSARRAALIGQAEARLEAANLFIPFGSPVRFALVRSSVTGFAPNPGAFHPLPALAQIPR